MLWKRKLNIKRHMHVKPSECLFVERVNKVHREPQVWHKQRPWWCRATEHIYCCHGSNSGWGGGQRMKIRYRASTRQHSWEAHQALHHKELSDSQWSQDQIDCLAASKQTENRLSSGCWTLECLWLGRFFQVLRHGVTAEIVMTLVEGVTFCLCATFKPSVGTANG